jgi:hypothetical protein
MKVVMDGTVRGRFMVTAGEPLSVGRAPTGGGVALGAWIDHTAVESVSRTHVVLDYDGAGLTVVDERSANGTRIRRRRPAGDELLPLHHGTRWQLRRGDSIVLHDRLELLPSGRQFVFEDDATDGTVGPRQAAAAADPTMVGLPSDLWQAARDAPEHEVPVQEPSVQEASVQEASVHEASTHE